MGEFTLLIWNRQVEKLFIKWYGNQVKRSILLLYVAQQTRQMKWTKLFGPTSSKKKENNNQIHHEKETQVYTL